MPYLLSRQKEGFCMARASSILPQKSQVIPIIEPVVKRWHTQLSGLPKWLAAGRKVLLIINPYQHEFEENRNVVSLSELGVAGLFSSAQIDETALIPTLLVHENIGVSEVERILQTQHVGAIVHCRMIDDPRLWQLAHKHDILFHVFDVDVTHKSYRQSFEGKSQTILLKNAFVKEPSNRLYSEIPSRLHQLPWIALGEDVRGFSDYLIESKHYKSSGGAQSKAAAIHITYEQSEDESVWVQHFVGGPIPDVPRVNYAELFLLAAEKFVTFKRDNPEIWLDSYGCRLIEEAYYKEKSIVAGDVKEYALLHHLEAMSRLCESFT